MTNQMNVLQALGIAVLSASALAGSVIHVDTEAAGAETGQSWQHAFTDLQDALAIATFGDQVWVAEGTYKADSGTLDGTLSFMIPDGVEVYGGFDGTETQLAQRNPDTHVVVLDGDLLGDDDPDDIQTTIDNTWRLVLFDSVGPETLFDGFTVTRGVNRSPSGPPKQHATGLTVISGNPLIRNCVVTSNIGSLGPGGLAMKGDAHSIKVVDCAFTKNCNAGSGGVTQVANDWQVTFVNCVFRDNTTPTDAAVAAVAAGGRAVFVNCDITGNYINVFSSGALSAGFGPAWLELYNCTVTENSAGALGEGGAVVVSDGATLIVRNSILWGNHAPDADPTETQIGKFGNATIDVQQSCIEAPAGTFGPDNIYVDPLFANVLGPDGLAGTEDDAIELLFGSPCIDAGDDALVPADVADLDGDGDTAEPVPIDLAGAPRLTDVPFATDGGQGAVDMGCYEHSASVAAPWADQGQALAGSGGIEPVLAADGPLSSGSTATMLIAEGSPASAAVLVLGLSAISLPFKGGVLVPSPDITIGATLDGLGEMLLVGSIGETPPGASFYLQAWVADPGAPQGFSATNAVMGTTP